MPKRSGVRPLLVFLSVGSALAVGCTREGGEARSSAPAAAPRSAAAPEAFPAPEVVKAMVGFCALGQVAPPERQSAVETWLAAEKENVELANLWVAMGKGDRTAIARLHLAADRAVGAGNCDVLDVVSGEFRPSAIRETQF